MARYSVIVNVSFEVEVEAEHEDEAIEEATNVDVCSEGKILDLTYIEANEE